MQSRFRSLAIVSGTAAAAAFALAPAAGASPAKAKVRQAAGSSAAAIQPAVDAFRADLGGANNGAAPVAVTTGRREIAWDGVPANFSAPNAMPPDLFRARGALFSTRGQFLQVSANAADGPIEFDNLDPGASARFATFSPQKLFTGVGSPVVDVHFRKPGTDERATVSGFGAVFTDVDRWGSTKIAYYDRRGRKLGTFRVRAAWGEETLSFLGVRFKYARVAKVRIYSGNVALGAGEGGRRDAVVMDDLIYGEPQ
jgi:hypothetical protein